MAVAAAVIVLSASLGACRRQPGGDGPSCTAYAAASGPRKLGFWMPGDPAAHPGCTLVEAGDLQCPEDLVGETGSTMVKVPEAEARALLDRVERDAVAARCDPCRRSVLPTMHAPGFDPGTYPARLCRGKACVETCGDAKAALRDLRSRFAATRTGTAETLHTR